MKYCMLILVCLLGQTLFAQEKINTSFSIRVTGDVKQEKTIRVDDILHYTSTDIGDLKILNHLGDYKSTQKGLKGVLVKDVLEKINISSSSPKDLSEIYIIVIATDGYKVVYSWNELFNSPTGNNTFFITEKEGVRMPEMKESILLVTTSDFKTGRRNVKAVKEILIKRI